MAKTKFLTSENSRTILMRQDIDQQPENFTQILGAFLATLSALSMGMTLSWSSSAIPMLQAKDSHLKITQNQGDWIGSLITLGAAFGAMPAGSVANTFGRKFTLQLLAIPLILQWIILAYSQCIYGLYAARFLAGLACGAYSVAAPMYVAELAHTSIRGMLGTFFQVQITVGLLLEYILGGTVDDFKLLALVSAVLPVVFLLAFSFMPETPVHLYVKGRPDKAKSSLQYFRGSSYNVDDELTRIADDIKETANNKVKMSDLIDNRATIKGLIISLGLMIFQQLSGINAVLFYAANIFSETGSSMSPTTCAILVGAVQVIATLMSTFLIDRAGRKILLLISASVMCLCLIVLGIYFELKSTQDLSHLSIIPMVSLAIFVIVFSIGFGPIPWMIMGEILIPEIKGIASSISAAFNWTLAFTVTNQFGNMTSKWGIGITFIVFGVICGLGTLFVSILVPETKGKDIAEVQEILMGKARRQHRNDFEKTTAV